MRFPLSSSAFASMLVEALLDEFVRAKAHAQIIIRIAIAAIMYFLFMKVITRMSYLSILNILDKQVINIDSYSKL